MFVRGRRSAGRCVELWYVSHDGKPGRLAATENMRGVADVHDVIEIADRHNRKTGEYQRCCSATRFAETNRVLRVGQCIQGHVLLACIPDERVRVNVQIRDVGACPRLPTSAAMAVHDFGRWCRDMETERTAEAAAVDHAGNGITGVTALGSLAPLRRRCFKLGKFIADRVARVRRRRKKMTLWSDAGIFVQ